MKRNIAFPIVALLCLSIIVHAQQGEGSNIPISGIQIGQQVPDINIVNLQNYKDKTGKNATTVKISDFRGKILILDFWATWCSPCIAMIPRMDSLQKKFGDKVQFLSVTYQSKKEALSFLEKFELQQKRHFDLPLVTDSKELEKLFPHKTLPHYVWIDSEGVVRAITEAYYVNYENINKMINKAAITAKIKSDSFIKYNNTQPLLTPNSLTKDLGFLMQSTFANYYEGVGMGYNKNTFNQGENEYTKVTARNSTIRELFQYAYQKEAKEIVIEVVDSSKFFFKSKISSERMDWRRNGNAYCYELLLNTKTGLNSSRVMQRDLAIFFAGYDAKIEKRKILCLTLIKTQNSIIPNSKETSKANFTPFGGKITNCPLAVLIARLQFYLQKYPLPLADETNYKEWVDLDIKANMSNVDEINQALAKYDLKFVEKEATIDMLVIKDKPNNHIN